MKVNPFLLVCGYSKIFATWDTFVKNRYWADWSMTGIGTCRDWFLCVYAYNIGVSKYLSDTPNCIWAGNSDQCFVVCLGNQVDSSCIQDCCWKKHAITYIYTFSIDYAVPCHIMTFLTKWSQYKIRFRPKVIFICFIMPLQLLMSPLSKIKLLSSLSSLSSLFF